jgi:alcohol oxidase
MPIFRGEFISEHPKFPEGSEAATKLTDGPVALDAQKIKYTEADNKAIEAYIKEYREFLPAKNVSEKGLSVLYP